MENRNYRCNYCKKEYIPKRRRVQKFCSNSCRVGFFKLQKKSTMNYTELSGLEKRTKKQTVEALSIAGVGNATIGNLAADAIKSIFVNDDNKPVTKADLKRLSLKLERFQMIKNMNSNIYGQKAYFDCDLSIVVYR
ncbi:hypothetical protein [Polaribacter sp.]|uniref:hypothetical protein n=1 Tax=Polaribacter sp. TaxID=1920175 RepID=UPI0035C7F42D